MYSDTESCSGLVPGLPDWHTIEDPYCIQPTASFGAIIVRHQILKVHPEPSPVQSWPSHPALWMAHTSSPATYGGLGSAALPQAAGGSLQLLQPSLSVESIWALPLPTNILVMQKVSAYPLSHRRLGLSWPHPNTYTYCKQT